MTSTEDLKAALMRLPEDALALVDPASAVADGWSQIATTFASLTQGSNNSDVASTQGLLGQWSQIAFDLVGREDELRRLISSLVATL